MPRREILTSSQRTQLLAFPDDEGELIRRYTLTKADLAFVRQHRGDHNRLGIAVHGVLGTMQRIFRSASRRETFGKHSKGGRRDGGLKMDWTKPPPTAWPMCIECRLDLW